MRLFIPKPNILLTALALLGGLFSSEKAFCQQDALSSNNQPQNQTVTPNYFATETPEPKPTVPPVYYPIYMASNALAEAATKHLPIAWVYGSRVDFFAQTNAAPSVSADLTLTTFTYLGHLRQDVVIVGVAGKGALNQLPPYLKQQFLIPDDGPPPQEQNDEIQTPKIVFTNSSGDVALARIPFTQLQAMRETAIYNGLYSILHNPQDMQTLSNGSLHNGSESDKVITSNGGLLTDFSAGTSGLFSYMVRVAEMFLLLFAGLCIVMLLVGVRWPSLPRIINPSKGSGRPGR